MAYIYMVTNKINNKHYIGKTNFSIEQRWKQHLRDSNKYFIKNRPLYSAIQKYGNNNFFIELIEEVHESKSSEREKYWIEFYKTFENGYNATLGGDGKQYIDYDLVIASYQQTQNCSETARQLNIHLDSVKKILKSKNIKIVDAHKVNQSKVANIGMYNLKGQLLKTFTSLHMAAYYLIENNISTSKTTGFIRVHIASVCKGLRKTAYKHIWKYIE